MDTKQKNRIPAIVPVMLAFFVMGFVDLVGTASNYIKADFGLSDKLANLLPSIVFFWFLIFSVPTGLLMNRIGRRKTVVLSLGVTALSLLLPVITYNFTVMMISFCLLGIGNTLMQVSVNPLMSDIVTGDKLASNLTLGQFVKAIASFLAPVIAGYAAKQFGNWMVLFPVYMVIAIAATLWLWASHIEERQQKMEGASFLSTLSLLRKSSVLLLFIGIMCHVGIDVGINFSAPRILMERTGISLEDAGFATGIYFIFRLIGCLTGTFALARFDNIKFFALSVALMIISMIGLFLFDSTALIYVSIALVGFGNSNIFPIILSKAMLSMPDRKNDISALMIMGLFGGTLFPIVMGYASDAAGTQNGAIAVISIGVLYLLLMTFKLKTYSK